MKTNNLMEDCIFYDRKKKQCRALKQLYCATEDKPCNFYKEKVRGKGVRK